MALNKAYLLSNFIYFKHPPIFIKITVQYLNVETVAKEHQRFFGDTVQQSGLGGINRQGNVPKVLQMLQVNLISMVGSSSRTYNLSLLKPNRQPLCNRRCGGGSCKSASKN